MIVAETSRYGLATIRRIYGDWTTSNMHSWKDTLHVHAFQPIQQFRYTTGKNATDSAMIIDAMDILHGAVVNAFCLVSSDSDFTRLATRIREQGIFVMGIGNKTTPRAFVNACEVFVYNENLLPETDSAKPASQPRGAKAKSEAPAEPLPLIKQAFELSVQDDGWAFLGVVGTRLRQLDPGFDPRTYGYKQLSHLIRDYSGFEIRENKIRGGPSLVHIRLRD